MIHGKEVVREAVAQARSHTETHEHRMAMMPLDARDDFTMPDFRTTAGYVYWLCDEVLAYVEALARAEEALRKIIEGSPAVHQEGLVEACRIWNERRESR